MFFEWDPSRRPREVARAHGFSARRGPAHRALRLRRHRRRLHLDPPLAEVAQVRLHARVGQPLARDPQRPADARRGDRACCASRGDETPHEDIERFCDYAGITTERFFEIAERFRNPDVWTRRDGTWVIEDFLDPRLGLALRPECAGSPATPGRRAARRRARSSATLRADAPPRARPPARTSASRRPTAGTRRPAAHAAERSSTSTPRSNQPFHAGRRWLAFNGELYNYVEVRDELEARAPSSAPSPTPRCCATALDRDGWDGARPLRGHVGVRGLRRAHRRARRSRRDRFGEKPLYLLPRRRRPLLRLRGRSSSSSLLGRSPARSTTRHLQRYLVNGYKALYKTRRHVLRGARGAAAGRAGSSVGPARRGARRAATGAAAAPRGDGDDATRRRSRARASG